MIDKNSSTLFDNNEKEREEVKKILESDNSPLLKKYKNDGSALDCIHPEDLEAYYDSFLIPDTSHLDGRNYKVRLRFYGSIVGTESDDEFAVISRIEERRNLNSFLVEHPLVCVFLALKWHAMKNYFWAALLLQALLVLATGCFLLSSSTAFLSAAEFFLFLFNAVIKLKIFFNHAFSKRAPVHGFMEMLVIFTQILAFFDHRFRAVVFTEVTVCFFLTAGYYYENTKLGFFLDKIFKILSFLLTISMIIYLVCYLFDYRMEEYNIFKNFSITAFRIYNMTTEISVRDVKFDESGGFNNNLYALLPIFLPKAIAFIVKLSSGKGEKNDDSGEIDEETEIDALKNSLSFMKFVERLYKENPFNIIRKYFPNPFLFSCLDHDRNICNDSNKCREVVFYVNRKNKQFGNNAKKYPSKLNKDCVEKVKLYCKEAEKNALKKNIQDILSRLQTLENILRDNYQN